VLTAEEWARDSDVAGASWRGDGGGDMLEDKTGEKMLLLEAILAFAGG
jgi:hypothetical protein